MARWWWHHCNAAGRLAIILWLHILRIPATVCVHSAKFIAFPLTIVSLWNTNKFGSLYKHVFHWRVNGVAFLCNYWIVVTLKLDIISDEKKNWYQCHSCAITMELFEINPHLIQRLLVWKNVFKFHFNQFYFIDNIQDPRRHCWLRLLL